MMEDERSNESQEDRTESAITPISNIVEINRGKCIMCDKAHSASGKQGTPRNVENLVSLFRDGLDTILPKQMHSYGNFWYCSNCEPLFQEMENKHQMFESIREDYNQARTKVAKVVVDSIIASNYCDSNSFDGNVFDSARSQIFSRWWPRLKSREGKMVKMKQQNTQNANCEKQNGLSNTTKPAASVTPGQKTGAVDQLNTQSERQDPVIAAQKQETSSNLTAIAGQCSKTPTQIQQQPTAVSVSRTQTKTSSAYQHPASVSQQSKFQRQQRPGVAAAAPKPLRLTPTPVNVLSTPPKVLTQPQRPTSVVVVTQQPTASTMSQQTKGANITQQAKVQVPVSPACNSVSSLTSAEKGVESPLSEEPQQPDLPSAKQMGDVESISNAEENGDGDPIIIAVKSLSTRTRARNLSGDSRGGEQTLSGSASVRKSVDYVSTSPPPRLNYMNTEEVPCRPPPPIDDLSTPRNALNKMDMETASFAAGALVSANVANVTNIRTNTGLSIRVIYTAGRPGSVKIKRNRETNKITDLFTSDKSYLDALIDDTGEGTLIITPKNGGPPKTFRYTEKVKKKTSEKPKSPSPTPPTLERMDLNSNASVVNGKTVTRAARSVSQSVRTTKSPGKGAPDSTTSESVSSPPSLDSSDLVEDNVGESSVVPRTSCRGRTLKRTFEDSNWVTNPNELDRIVKDPSSPGRSSRNRTSRKIDDTKETGSSPSEVAREPTAPKTRRSSSRHTATVEDMEVEAETGQPNESAAGTTNTTSSRNALLNADNSQETVDTSKEQNRQKW